jgi:anti-sigma-K factor RskA
MKFSDETVMAYVDGELDAATRSALEDALAEDGELAERVARQRRLRTLFGETYDAVLDEPVPARLQQALKAAPHVPPRGPRWHEQLREWLRPLVGPQAFAMAACAVFGVAIGVGLRGAASPFDTVDGRLVARGALAKALNERLASEDAADGVRLGVSFAAKGGGYCRSFALAAKEQLAGLACRVDAGWQIDLLTTATAGGSGAYRQASSETPPAVLRAIDERIAGSALDAQAERAARERGWR